MFNCSLSSSLPEDSQLIDQVLDNDHNSISFHPSGQWGQQPRKNPKKGYNSNINSNNSPTGKKHSCLAIYIENL